MITGRKAARSFGRCRPNPGRIPASTHWNHLSQSGTIRTARAFAVMHPMNQVDSFKFNQKNILFASTIFTLFEVDKFLAGISQRRVARKVWEKMLLLITVRLQKKAAQDAKSFGHQPRERERSLLNSCSLSGVQFFRTLRLSYGR